MGEVTSPHAQSREIWWEKGKDTGASYLRAYPCQTVGCQSKSDGRGHVPFVYYRIRVCVLGSAQSIARCGMQDLGRTNFTTGHFGL
jgi:hypothetical protein